MKAYIVQMKEPGDLALSTERGLRENILEGGCAWMTARNAWDAREWADAADAGREPRQYLYAVAYAGPGKQALYTTLRIENAKRWKRQRDAVRARDGMGGGTVFEVELQADPMRGDGEPVPKSVTGVVYSWGIERIYDFRPDPTVPEAWAQEAGSAGKEPAVPEAGTGGSRGEDPAAGKQETGRGAGTPPRD